ncbi:MAG: DUF2975 domain-containing protein [Clostridiales Family XIII bacterium]|jgi:hypothetical protein|nr:DUF2975 domain-containing protein [Clostridiales Family XIII bacterium]
MWNDQKSITLSLVCTWVAIAAVAAFAVSLPFAPRWFPYDDSILYDPELVARLMPGLYGCCAAALAALVLLLLLLGAIRAGEVFTRANVRRLRAISWCSFAIFAILIVSAVLVIPTPAMIVIALTAGFFCLLMRVVKNVIDAARLIKEENDFTV